MVDLSDICECVTCSRRTVNKYLAAGYRLIGVEQETLWTSAPKSAKGVDGYVKKNIIFIVGRPESVEPFEPTA